MKRVIIFGESMIELSAIDSQTYRKSFAGDAHSTAIYLKRSGREYIDCLLLSAIGNDHHSAMLKSVLKEENITIDLLIEHPNKTLGLYDITNDDNGERYFSYWRDNSAARDTIELLMENTNLQKNLHCDYFFFSGISLAILNKSSRLSLWKIIKQLKKQGTTIIFDPNYRQRLWGSPLQAKDCITTAINLSDIILPGMDDLKDLFSLSNFDAVKKFIGIFEYNKIWVVKNGANSIFFHSEEVSFMYPINPIKAVVDSTAAGDSFNGSFISAIIRNKDITEAMKYATNIARRVIQHRGAILPKEDYHYTIN
ncbi:sugar kinase [Agarilytica rhodophyticola]|uniref:sugar kinase n=1 Tax=Agarilytica rhodophyticola TaxID=1737490 RepID=UPI000B34803E|nr:sugar kinase [Agarilytica rhodophyticola]